MEFWQLIKRINGVEVVAKPGAFDELPRPSPNETDEQLARIMQEPPKRGES